VILVCLDTSTAAGSVALLRERELLASTTGDSTVPHARRLPADVLNLLAGAGLSASAVDLFAVVTGPGAFTGLRIGIASIQGLAFANSRPVVGISALEASAHAVLDADPADGLIGVLLDAARREVFTALYDASVEGTIVALRPIEPPAVSSAAVALERWAPLAGTRPVRLTGSGAIACTEALTRVAIGTVVVRPSGVLAASAGRLAYDAHAAGQSGPPHALHPLYVRRPDAELARAAAIPDRR
jgi:tRNA threonylcarbamoyladenosine biosynthesis protein TsaB